MTSISSLFKQTKLLIGLAFRFISFIYYRKESILSTLIDKPGNVKESLKDPDIVMDNISWTCLFGDNFEEKLLKNTKVKQKSKLNFSGFQRKF